MIYCRKNHSDGSTTEYDLAGETPALENIKAAWNDAKANGLNDTKAYALYSQELLFDGDIVVSTESQRAPGFNGIIDFKNNVQASHGGVTKKIETAQYILEIMGRR